MSTPIKHNDPEIPIENPFKNCKLDREKHADTLTTIIESYANGFVLALDGKWGAGKTTFVKMWKQKLENKDFKTIYFNAWENDFANEPLTALLGELQSIVGDKKEKYNSLVKKGATIAKSVLPALAKGVITKYMEAGVALDVIKESLDAATDILEKEADEYLNKKQSLTEFKTELEEYIKETCGEKPLIFFIDELDRCRPDYAVEVLEKVKHFFSVEGIVFVLSIDKTQLGHSIQGYYGSDKIDSTEYLRRFIDLEYQLPEPKPELFCNYLYNYYRFDIFFDSEERKNINILQSERNDFILFSRSIFDQYKYSLRQQEKIFAYTRLVLKSFEKNSYSFPTVFFLLIHLKTFNIDLYNEIKSKQLTIQDLVNKIENELQSILTANEDTQLLPFVRAEAYLIFFYNNCLSYKAKGPLTMENGDEKNLTFTSKSKPKELLRFLLYFKSNNHEVWNLEDIEIDYLINKIDLLDSLKSMM